MFFVVENSRKINADTIYTYPNIEFTSSFSF